jgi:malonyl-CoA/methylmalonyl-CoA synthetase
MGFTDDRRVFRDRPAIVDGRGVHTHAELDEASARAGAALSASRGDLAEARIALLIQPGFEFVAALMGVWRAGGLAVPLAVSDPAAELDFVLRDADVDTIVAGREFAQAVAPLASAAGIRLRTIDEVLSAEPRNLPVVQPDRRAMMVYSSGTTAKPKGVVTTHAAIAAQVSSLVEAWAWTPDDRSLLVLPLHHVHGLINACWTPIQAGGCCEMPPRFDATAAWSRLASGEITVFTAVPTVYHRLIAGWDAAPEATRDAWSAGARRSRLMMCGSAALPAHVLARWQEITEQILLERYGLTEVGMALSNPLHGTRRPSSVGTPLPGVDVRLVDEHGAPVESGSPGEVEVRGPGLFSEYWRRPDLTRAAFRDDWFRTGDVAVLENGAYRLLGRQSVDIIKSGGYKISALEVEDAVRAHPAVVDCAVVGIVDPSWGERVCVAVEIRHGLALSLDDLQIWMKERVSPYKVPKDLRCVPALPRNAMGKVLKPQVSAWFT